MSENEGAEVAQHESENQVLRKIEITLSEIANTEGRSYQIAARSSQENFAIISDLVKKHNTQFNLKNTGDTNAQPIKQYVLTDGFLSAPYRPDLSSDTSLTTTLTLFKDSTTGFLSFGADNWRFIMETFPKPTSRGFK